MLLHLETATDVCSAALSHNGKLLGYKESAEPRVHAAMLTVFITELLHDAGIEANAVDAVSISSGPGSYTGLRIASSVAKGFCYATGKPLIALDTLQIMAAGYKEEFNVDANALLCPMIDARRDEVYTALFDIDLHPLLASAPLILSPRSFADYTEKTICFFGSGAHKFNTLLGEQPTRLFMAGFYPKARHQVNLGTLYYAKGSFADVAYFEPNYLKEFYTPGKS